MARQIEVTPELLESAAGRIEGLAGDYERQYKNLYLKTDAMASTWSGKDNLAYTRQIDGFKDDFDNMVSLMKQYADFLRNSAKAYRETQNNIENEARRLAN